MAYRALTSLSSVSMVTKYTLLCWRASYIWYLKQNILPSTPISRRSNTLVLLDSRHGLYWYFNNSYYTNYANVAYDLLPYKMASTTLTIESNSKWRNCRRVTLCITLAHCRVTETTVLQFIVSISKPCIDKSCVFSHSNLYLTLS